MLASVHIDWQAVAAIIAGLGFVVLLLKDGTRRAGIAKFLRSYKGQTLTDLTNRLESAYELRQRQLEGEVTRLTQENVALKTGMEVLRAEVKALPAIQELSQKVDAGFERILTAIGGINA